jgi:sterol desaturase/sphingolipid hydroxylase (fatty acid hydroxylase superfamily)
MDALAYLGEFAGRVWPVLERNVERAMVVGLALFVVIFVIERAYGVSAGYYRSRGFLHDVAYWFYYRSGLHGILFFAFAFGALSGALAPYKVNVLQPLPFVLQALVYMAVVDFFNYWIHRAQHNFPFLWAFHSTHHSQEHLTFVTSQRVHPVDRLVHDAGMFLPLWFLGFDESAWMPLYVWGEFNLAVQHSRIPWRYGPLYPILVSPAFHNFHHSVDPAHHDRNFAGLFSFWDYVFGTAVADEGRAPPAYGLADEAPKTFMGTLTAPFTRLRGAYVRN